MISKSRTLMQRVSDPSVAAILNEDFDLSPRIEFRNFETGNRDPNFLKTSFEMANLEQMTVVELTTWLEQQGVPKDFCDVFSGSVDIQYIEHCSFLCFRSSCYLYAFPR